MGDRVVNYCCPEAVTAYPAPCPDHGQDRPDVATSDGETVLFEPGWFIPGGVILASERFLPGPLYHYSIEQDGTLRMIHEPKVRPKPSLSRVLSDLWDGLRAIFSWYDAAVGNWARRIIYDMHKPVFLVSSRQVHCRFCSRPGKLMAWPCDPVRKIAK